MLSAFFILNWKGEALVARIFRNDVKRTAADTFRIHVITAPQVRSPVTVVDGTAFMHVKHENLYLVTVAKTNANVPVAFEFCHKVVQLGEAYFGALNEESVKANFTLIYELVDEIMDFGFPQASDFATLKQYITSESVRSEANPVDASRITVQATGATSWRRPDIKYRKNEVFLDVTEHINLLMSNKGTILNSDVSGTIKMKAYLSGTPECRIGLNERASMEGAAASGRAHGALDTTVKKTAEIEDFQFHQCVKLGRLDAERSISFIPPDGEFDLMRYRATDALTLPFKVMAVVTPISATRLEYKVTLKATIPRKYTAQSVVVRIPTPPNTTAVHGMGTFANGHGKAKHVGAENSIVWKVARIQGGAEIDLNGEVEIGLAADRSTQPQWVRPPISVDFTVPMFTPSGVHIRYLKVHEKSGYETTKWVRLMCKAGSYQFRF